MADKWFKQILYANVLDIVDSFEGTPQHDSYVNAASTFRMPYWDWAAAPSEGQSVLPTSLTVPEVQITLPNGTATIPNPLYAYRFHPRPDDFLAYVSPSPFSSSLKVH